ncbi:hypothetical protein ABB37_07887 [Leptomonas pyrrhocoris]|uniref:Uncharacterized protein n=1 Tax=Leptomonas pyrrhocoris TaxID=157538 RepID=A0A0M9FU39_LEPPY|nr:hypothetical protein ABB37_07887 [Leptomonas pyrrhocoris]KPA76115.1 hypothetical protein ABB37_07887 [Leptomonas pyrrhocoris]|eukprot:XP_015654554.1 hypothetical protein ABB37_07887 [Leptomonas pyrrhocoris]
MAPTFADNMISTSTTLPRSSPSPYLWDLQNQSSHTTFEFFLFHPPTPVVAHHDRDPWV